MSGCIHSFLNSLESSMGSEMRNLSLNSAKFLGSYLGRTGMILDISKVGVGPSPALLLEKPLPRARVRATAMAVKLGNESVFVSPNKERHLRRFLTTTSLGLHIDEKRKSIGDIDLFVIENLLRTQRPNRNPLRLRECKRREDW